MFQLFLKAIIKAKRPV